MTKVKLCIVNTQENLSENPVNPDGEIPRYYITQTDSLVWMGRLYRVYNKLMQF